MSTSPHDLPLMSGLPKGDIPYGRPLVLASGSPRRAQLMTAAGYQFRVSKPDDSVECGICSRETAPEMVARLAYQKAATSHSESPEHSSLQPTHWRVAWDRS